MRLWNILSFVILGILSLVQGEDTRGTADKAATDFYYHIFEAEEFGNLPFYGNWYSKPDLGWYIKEHRHASGRAFVVCDELNINSVMTKRMESPLAPGDLKLFVRVALMRLGPGNQLQASVGRWAVRRGAIRLFPMAVGQRLRLARSESLHSQAMLSHPSEGHENRLPRHR